MSISMKNSDLIPIVKDKGLNNKLIHDHIYIHIINFMGFNNNLTPEQKNEIDNSIRKFLKYLKSMYNKNHRVLDDVLMKSGKWLAMEISLPIQAKKKCGPGRPSLSFKDIFIYVGSKFSFRQVLL